MRIPALLPPPFDLLRDFFARFFAIAKRAEFVDAGDLGLVVSLVAPEII